MSVRKSKEELRQKLRTRRKSIAETDFLNWSKEIQRKLQNQKEFQLAEIIHCYVSMNERREVNTHDLIKKMLQAGRKVVVPLTQFSDGTLRHFALTSFDDLAPNRWGVLEPSCGEQIPKKSFGLIVVPMVGGDENRHRIGYGGGFYDRFLAEVACPTIGLCFEQNIIPKLPTGSYDISLDKIITQDRIIR